MIRGVCKYSVNPLAGLPVSQLVRLADWWSRYNMKIKSFEDLECWKEARALTRTIYDYTKRSDFSKDFRLSG